MNKPFSMICGEFKQELVDLINNSSLPPFIIESIMQNCLFEISNVARNQYQVDKAQYEKSLKEAEKKAESSKDSD